MLTEKQLGEIRTLEKHVGPNNICTSDYSQSEYTFSIGAISEINKAFDRLHARIAEQQREIELLTREIAYCGSCKRFLNEDLHGIGACDKFNRKTSCDSYKPECFEWRGAGKEQA